MSRPLVPRVCKQCSKPFLSKCNHTLYCTKSCKNAYYRNPDRLTWYQKRKKKFYDLVKSTRFRIAQKLMGNPTDKPWAGLGPIGWALVEYLHKHRDDPMVWVSKERLENHIYGYEKPGESAIRGLVHYQNRKLREIGWIIRTRQGYYGGYRLCKLGEELPKQSIPDGAIKDLQPVTGTI